MICLALVWAGALSLMHDHLCLWLLAPPMSRAEPFLCILRRCRFKNQLDDSSIRNCMLVEISGSQLKLSLSSVCASKGRDDTYDHLQTHGPSVSNSWLR